MYYNSKIHILLENKIFIFKKVIIFFKNIYISFKLKFSNLI